MALLASAAMAATGEAAAALALLLAPMSVKALQGLVVTVVDRRVLVGVVVAAQPLRARIARAIAAALVAPLPIHPLPALLSLTAVVVVVVETT